METSKRGISKRLLDLLFPEKCPFCRTLLKTGEDPLCHACRKALPWQTGEQTRRKVDFAEGCFSPLVYRGAVVDAVHRFKFSGVRAYARPFGMLMADCFREQAPGGADVVCWVPLSRKRLRRRGYDQTRLLALAVAEELGLPAVPVLEKVRQGEVQSHLEQDSARRANVQGAFRVLDGSLAAERRILLVDDVVTSGATLGECALQLRLAGAREVRCLTLCSAREDGRKNGGKNSGKNG